MEKENVARILYALIEDCGNLITKSDIKQILSEALDKIQRL